MTAPDAWVLAAALARLDRERIGDDVGALVRIPSVTGAERPVVELLAGMARAAGLQTTVHEHDLDRLRACAGHPGEEA